MTDYVRIPIRAVEHQRLVALQESLVGQIDSYLARPSLSDIIKYILDRVEQPKGAPPKPLTAVVPPPPGRKPL